VVGHLFGVTGVVVKMGGSDVYITQCLGRGTISPTSTWVVCASGRVSKLRTASFAAASTRSLPLMWECPRIVCRVVRKPNDALVYIQLLSNAF